jgi:hypothetical protein
MSEGVYYCSMTDKKAGCHVRKKWLNPRYTGKEPLMDSRQGVFVHAYDFLPWSRSVIRPLFTDAIFPGISGSQERLLG